tara:strand:- start:1269 stop:1718 length:450 start_codon:yes stop_codon:yes gene_type:complete
MPSQIKVDEIKNVAGQYEIKTNTLKGQTTAGSITLQGEGTATTNLQQGLIKVWARMDCNTSSAVTLNDSFNVSSVSDTAVGRSIINFSNNMSNTTYALLGAGDATIGSEYNYVCCESSSTDHVDVAHMYGHSSLIDTKDNGHGIVGDLA